MAVKQFRLLTHRGLTLAPRLAEAEAASHTAAEAELYKRNLLTQLTIWGTGGPYGDSEISDYANREYHGLILPFYQKRCVLKACGI